MSNLFEKYKRFGIFGPSESGKTTLAKKVSIHFWNTEKRRSLVLDPVSKSNWGPHATVFVNEPEFWKIIFKEKNAVVIVDDASVTINRDNELNGVFTTLRHQGHKLVVIGHSGRNLLPQMRDQLQRVFLFKQTPKSVEQWEENFPGIDLTPATTLPQYSFITFANYEQPQVFALTK